jgi:hypothetical protein
MSKLQVCEAPWSPPRPLHVLTLRQVRPADEWLETWRELTAVLFQTGLGRPETVAFGVFYDLPWRRLDQTPRYDACLTVDPAHVNPIDLLSPLAECPGLRYEVMMANPWIEQTDVLQSRRLAGMGRTSLSDEELQRLRATKSVGLPLYELYPCSPIFLGRDVPVVAHLHAVPPRRLGREPRGAPALGLQRADVGRR